MKSDRKRQRYTTAFKAEAVRLFVEGERSAAAVARDLEVRPDLLRKWVQEHRAAGQVPAPVRELTDAERIRRLERELAVVRQERDFLKKATAFFAKESP
jgi:transposase